MKWMKRKFKRSLAMFLALCMVLTSFQGVAFADAESSAEDRDILIELDGAALKEEAEAAIRSGEFYNADVAFQEMELAESADSEDKVKLIDSDLYGDIFDQSTGSIYKLKNIPYVSKASASEAMRKDAEMQIFVKLNGQAAETASGSSALKASDSSLRLKASSSELPIITDNYEMRGDEKIIFLFINRSEADLTFQLDIDGMKSAFVLVESKSVLLAEDEEEVEELPVLEPETPAADEVIESVNPDAGGIGGGSGAGGSGGSVSDDSTENTDKDNETTDNETTDNEATDNEGQEPSKDKENGTQDSNTSSDGEVQPGTDGSDKEQTEGNGGSDSNGGKDQSQPGGSQDGSKPDDQKQDGQGSESQSGNQGENQTGNQEGSADAGKDQAGGNSGNAGNDNSSEDSSDKGSTGGSGFSDNGNTSEGSGSGSGSTGSGSSDSGSSKDDSSGSGSSDSGSSKDSSSGSGSSDSGSSSQGGGDVQVSISSHHVDRVMAFVPQDSYADDDEEAPKTPEEEFEMMYGDDEEDESEDEDDEEDYNDDIEVYSSDVEGVDLPAEVYPTVLVKKTSRISFYRSSRAVSNTEQVKASAGALMTTYGNLTAGRDADYGDFRINLYDYNEKINGTLLGKYGIKGDTTKYFYFNPAGGNNLQNTWLPYYFGNSNTIGSEYDPIAFQGIMADTYNGSGKIKGASQYDFGEQGAAYLFPESGRPPSESGFDAACYNVRIGSDVLQRSGNYYVLNSIHEDYLKLPSSIGAYKGESIPITLNSAKNTLIEASGSNHYQFRPFGTNSYYGMKLSFDFNLPADGMATEAESMSFRFAGDDDVWVYIGKKDDNSSMRLAMDLGGIHGLTGGTINFATGIVTHDNVLKTPNGWTPSMGGFKAVSGSSHGPAYWYLYTREDAWNRVNTGKMSKTEYATISKFVGLERPDGAGDKYTFDFYYLERGAGYANCYMDFNLPIIPAQGVKIQKKIQGDIPNHAEYKFNVVSSSDRNTLENYKNGTQTSLDGITVNALTINGAGEASVNLNEGTYFYVEESDSCGANQIKWDMTGDEVFPPETGKETPIHQVSSKSGYLVQCTNIYGDLNPQIAKRAWKDYTVTNEGEYDITLEVTGDEIKTTTGGTAAEPVDVIFVMDKSSSIKKSDFAGMKTAVSDMAGSLAAGSKVSVIAFSGDGLSGTIYPYDNTNASKYYTNVTGGWISAKDTETLNKKFEKLFQSNYTHTAAGFLGAKHMLDDKEVASDANKKTVIFMTDGLPNTYVYQAKGGWNWSGADNKNHYLQGIETATTILNTLPDVSVYAIGYGAVNSSSYAYWLQHENTPKITGYYPANNIDELKAALTDISKDMTVLSSVKDPVVTDILSNNVILSEQQIGGASVFAPELYVKEGKVTGTNPKQNKVVNDKGIKLNSKYLTEEKKVVYTYPQDEVIIAEYDTEKRAITWYVGRSSSKKINELAKETRTLTYRVTAKDQLDEPTRQGQDDTGTHSGESGYRSNDNAKLTYDGGSKEFKHPVVNPVKSKLTISKTVAGVAEGDDLSGNYSFSLKFDDGREFKKPDDAVWNDSNKTYTFNLSAGESIEFSDLPKGIGYKVEETEATIKNTDYVLTGISVKGTGTDSNDSGMNNRPTSLSTTGKVVAGGSTANFTNTYSKYGYITLIKTLDGDENSYPTERNFTFNITPSQGAGYPSSITVAAGNTGETLKIEPEDIDKIFVITEADTKGAWKTTSKVNQGTELEKRSAEVKAGQAVTFTNYYYKHELELSKVVLNSTNPVPDATYKFVVKMMTKNSTKLQQTDIKLGDEQHNITEFMELNPGEYQFSIMLKAGETVKVVDIPKNVTSYEVTEDLQGSNGISEKYRPELYSVTKDEVKTLGAEKAEGTFAEYESQSDRVTFTNKLAVAEGKLHITKNLVKENSADFDAVEAKEDLTFTFKVTNTDTNEFFYVSVTVASGQSIAEKEITVPVGDYVIEEMLYLQYSAVETEKKATVVPGDAPGQDAKVAFHNYKTSDGYFTDVNVKINTVDENGFPEKNNTSKRSPSPVASLPSSPTKSSDDKKNI